MSQITLNSLTTLLNTSFKTLLAVASICLFAVSANAAELDANGQDKINAKATVLVSGKTYTHNYNAKQTVIVPLSKLITFKTPKDMSATDTDCKMSFSFSALEIKGVTPKTKCEANFTLPMGWTNTKVQNDAINATLVFVFEPDDIKNYTSIKLATSPTTTDLLTVEWTKNNTTTNVNNFTQFKSTKKIKINGIESYTTGAAITLKISSKEKANTTPFTATDARVVVKNKTSDSDKVTGEIKISFKNDAQFQGLDSVVLTVKPEDMKLFNDKLLLFPFTSDTFYTVENASYPNFEKTLYFKVDSPIVKAMEDVGTIKTLIYTAENGNISSTTFSDVTICVDSTNHVALKLSKTELKDIKVKTDVTGTIEFEKALVADITYTIDSTNATVTGVTFDSKSIAFKKGDKKKTFKVSFEPNTTAKNFTIKAETSNDSANAAIILNKVLRKEIAVSVFTEKNEFVNAKKGVTATLKNNLKVKIPFKFKKAVKETVNVTITVTGSNVSNNKIPGTDFATTQITVDTKKSSFNLEFSVTDITQFNGLGDKYTFTATVSGNYPASGLQSTDTTTNTFETTNIISKFIKADLSWTVDGKVPTTAQLNATSPLATDSKVSLFVELTQNMGNNNDTNLKTLLDKAFTSSAKIPVILKVDKNAQIALDQTPEGQFNISFTDSSTPFHDYPIPYCASKKLKGALTLSTKVKGIKIGVKKVTFLVGDELDLDPYAVTVTTPAIVFASSNAYSSIDRYFTVADTQITSKDVTDVAVYKTRGIAKDGKHANIKLYVGTGVAKNDIFSADKTDFVEANVDTALIKVAPALSFYVCDPITNKNELKSPKKIALKAPKGKEFIVDSKFIDYTIPSSPVVYNKKELTNYRKAGHFFSALDAKTDTLIQPKHGFAGGVVMMAWKQGKKNEAGYIDAKESKDKDDHISVITFAPATIADISGDSLMNTVDSIKAFNFATDTGMTIAVPSNIVISGDYINAKATLSAEYLDGTTVKVATFKFGKDDVKYDGKTSTLTFPINAKTAAAFKKLSTKEFYLILDNGTGLTSPKAKFTFGTKFFN